MKDWTAIRERYMHDPLPVRLGGLAANLSRIKSFSANEASRDTVASLIDESKTFIEWTAAQAETETAENWSNCKCNWRYGNCGGNTFGQIQPHARKLPSNRVFGRNKCLSYQDC